jgi:hypothetical protein
MNKSRAKARSNVEASPKVECFAALAYYKKTVWDYVEGLPLAGAQYAVALCAWNRLQKTHHAWDKLAEQAAWERLRKAQHDGDKTVAGVDQGETREAREAIEAREIGQRIDKLHPQRLERGDTITAELLASLAASRFGAPKPKGVQSAIVEAHRLLMAARDHLKALESGSDADTSLEALCCNAISFKDVLASGNQPDSFPLLPTQQKNRNKGELSLRALEQELERHARDYPGQLGQMGTALDSRKIFPAHLEEVRWQRFRRRYKPR